MARSVRGDWQTWYGATIVAALPMTGFIVMATVLTLPNSSPPSADAAISASLWFWLVSVAAVGVGASFPLVRSRLYRMVSVGATVALLMWVTDLVGMRYEHARLDSCFWGTGGGAQSLCFASASDISWVRWIWWGAFAVAATEAVFAAWLTFRVKRNDTSRERSSDLVSTE